MHTDAMILRRLNRKLVALLAYALVVNITLWASSPLQALDARHVLCGQQTGMSTATPIQSDAGHTCCDLACAAAGHVPPPAQITVVPLNLTEGLAGANPGPTAVPTLASYRPPVRGPPEVQ